MVRRGRVFRVRCWIWEKISGALIIGHAFFQLALGWVLLPPIERREFVDDFWDSYRKARAGKDLVIPWRKG